MNETDLMHEIMEAVSARGCDVFRVNVGKVRLQDGRWFDTGLPKGHPDLYGFIHPTGRVFYIECKVPPNKPTPEQLNFIQHAKNSGALACVAYCVEDALGMINNAVWEGMGLVIMDPAAEKFPEDSSSWVSILTWASDCRELFEALLNIRECGAKLEKDEKWGMRIVPCERRDVYQESLKIFQKYKEQLKDELFWLGKVGA